MSKQGTKIGGVIANESNKVLNRIKKDFPKKDTDVVYIQANEVIHEGSYRELRLIPEIYPNCAGYFLYFLGFVGPHGIGGEYRMRYAPLRHNVSVINDGWTMGLTGKVPPKEFIRSLIAQTYHYIFDGYDERLWDVYNKFKFVYTSMPIFRYNLVFRDNVAKKFEGHAQIFRSAGFQDKLSEVEELKSLSKREFWENFYKVYDKRVGSNRVQQGHRYPFKVNFHPKIMEGLLGKDKYIIREEVIEDIIRL